MTKLELELYLKNYIDNCYIAECIDYPNMIYMFHDKNYVRMMKIAKLEGKEIVKNNITGDLLFKINTKNKHLIIDVKIWEILSQYTKDYADFKMIILNSFNLNSFKLNDFSIFYFYQDLFYDYTRYTIKNNQKCSHMML